MGIDTFSYSLFDDTGFVEEILYIYVNWEIKVIRNLVDLGFDIIWAADDLAYKTGLFFSPKIFRGFIFKWLKETSKNIKIPWIFHTDGNFLRF